MNPTLARRALQTMAVFAILFALSLLLLLSQSPSRAAEQSLVNRKLSGVMQPAAEVDSVVFISPDSQRVVYWADATTDAMLELFTTRTDGESVPAPLSTALPEDTEPDQTGISPDSSRVVYIAPTIINGAGFFKLFSAPINGGPPTPLDDPLLAPNDVFEFAITPDSSHVIYTSESVVLNAPTELFRVPITGGPSIRLIAPFAPGQDVDDFTISPDGSLVVYTADQETDGVSELFSVPAGGGIPTKLNGLLPTGGNVGRFRISPNSTRVVYVADQNTDETTELFSVPIGGGSVARLNGDLPPGGNVERFLFEISGDSSRVVYMADERKDELTELFSVAIGGRDDPIALNGSLVTGGAVRNFLISPDSARVVYLAAQDTAGQNELYSVPIAGGPVVKLNGVLVSGGNVRRYLISPDTRQSARVVYQADQQTDGADELYNVPIAGGTTTNLNLGLVSGGDTLNFAISPDDSRVVFIADRQTDDVRELWESRMIGAAVQVVRLSSPLVTGGSVVSFAISPDSDRVVYVADQETQGFRELWVTLDDSLLVPTATATAPPTETPDPGATPTATPSPTATPPPPTDAAYLPAVLRN